ncbi:MAG: preprotein translocase subunit SecA [Clostridiaceae bacterium]|nr:preprotein translocase subunit SecA [Clostridiaceae bacterium]
MGLFSKIFGTRSEREIRKMRGRVEATMQLEEKFRNLSDADLRGQTALFREQLDRGATLEDLLAEAFATVREASRRVLNMMHYRVQIIGGIVLHEGRIAEMKTGEGKTLVATLPVYLNALAGRGVHVVTVNDYLARRDSEWMGKIYRYLGMDVGLIVHGRTNDERRESYAADIVYGTNNEFGFDYLRDNMVTSRESMVQRELDFAIVDEVDSILIDEARTPLIISGQGEASTEMYNRADSFVKTLRVWRMTEADKDALMTESGDDADYIVDEKAGTAVLTKQGVAKAERWFKVENLADEANYSLQHYINNALKANGTMHRDQQYVIHDGEVVIVDDFTGRLMFGRRYSDGLHQAIEAKEHVRVERESKTLATITFQNFFRMYRKLSGMTGTAMTEEEEFRRIYNLDVVEIPTNRPMIRLDKPDAVYKTRNGKYRALIEEVISAHEQGQPVLIGTISVEKSELLSEMFRRHNVPHNVLNAKNHEREAEIVAQAGRIGAVTIATNMAGRGTDILLGGNPEYMALQDLRRQSFTEELLQQATAHNVTDDQTILETRRRFAELERQYAAETQAERAKVIETGGLYIVGTERHESRRIDNQLRGRSGRQGDPGMSKFYLSLEDDLMRLFGGDRMQTIFSVLRVDEDMEIQSRLLTRTIESAQRRVEGRNFAIRRNVLEYDDVMNLQRNLIYGQRRDVLEGRDLREYYLQLLEEQVVELVQLYCSPDVAPEDWNFKGMQAALFDSFGDVQSFYRLAHLPAARAGESEELAAGLQKDVIAKYEERERALGEDLMREAERVVLLRTVDDRWMEHIDAMDELRSTIGTRAYAQHDPVTEYRREGYAMFEEMNKSIRRDACRLMMRANFTVQAPPKMEQRRVPEETQAEHREVESFAHNGVASGRPERPERPGRSERSERPGRSERSERISESARDADGLPAGAAAVGGSSQQPLRRSGFKVGRNDPCPCGSGKKYKNCHGRN